MVLHVVLGLLLLLFPAAVLYWFDKSLLGSFVVAFCRMAVQLLVLSLVVWALVKFDALWLSLLWLVLLCGGAGFFALRRMKLPMAQFLPAVSGGLLAGSLVVGMYLLLVSLPIADSLGAQWLVPVMSLLVGHSTTTTIRGLSAYHSALSTDRQQYEFLRGNGATCFQAAQSFVCRAFQAVFAPTVANLSVMGLFTMPLLLVGILLGGLTPLVSFVLTILLIVGCLACSVLSLGVTLWLAHRSSVSLFQ